MALFGLGKKEDKEKPVSQHNSPQENDLLCEIDNAQTYAEGGVRAEIETTWEDEYKMYIGGGKQWKTSRAYRSEKGTKRNFNSEDNFILAMVQNMLAPFSVAPTMQISGVEPDDDERAKTLNDLVPFILYRNKFPQEWNKLCEQFVKHGLAIVHVGYDQHWIGGAGPDKWVGEILVEAVDKSEFFPDPAILDLEKRLQECSFINIKKRKKLEWFAETWPEKGKYVIADNEKLEEGKENEGTDPKQATLIIHFHKGTPKYVPDEWKKIFTEKADKYEKEMGIPYYAKDLRDMARGTLKGVHCAFKANNILLDYIPYIYDDGLYPFVFRVLYADEKQPYGMGEIRNAISPQINHNKADEIELGAMLSQGIGGAYYGKGSISESQKREILDNISKPHAWIEVNDPNGIHERKQTSVPSNITYYKDSKKTVIDTITGNTAILQGISPGANVPYSTIAELGARADARTRRKAKILEGLMIEVVQLIINRIAQFYTEERKYRILGDTQKTRIQSQIYKILEQIANMEPGTPVELQMQLLVEVLKTIKMQPQRPRSGIFKRDMLVKRWEREPGKFEEFVPEFDVKVKVAESKPTDRNYYVNMAMSLLGRAMGIKAFWKTVEEGHFPPVEEIIEELEETQRAQAEAQQQAQMAALQAQQQEKQADREYGVLKQKLQNDSVERQVAMKALAKAGVR